MGTLVFLVAIIALILGFKFYPHLTKILLGIFGIGFFVLIIIAVIYSSGKNNQSITNRSVSKESLTIVNQQYSPCKNAYICAPYQITVNNDSDNTYNTIHFDFSFSTTKYGAEADNVTATGCGTILPHSTKIYSVGAYTNIKNGWWTPKITGADNLPEGGTYCKPSFQ